MVVPFLCWTASAEPLWVEPAAVDEVRRAAEALWPGGPLEVGERPPVPGEGFLWDGATLAWIHDGRAWTEPAADAATVVLLARSWLREAPAGEGWIPAAPEVPVVPEAPAPPPAPRPEAPRRTDLVLGFGARSTYGRLAPDGLRVSAGALAPHVELEGTVFLATAEVGRPGGLEAVFVTLTGEAVVTPVDVATFAAVGGWDLEVPRRIADRWTVAPVLLGGAQIGEVARRLLSPAAPMTPVGTGRQRPGRGRLGPVSVEQAHRFELAGLLGVAAEVWWSTSLGLRGSAVDRVAYRTSLGSDDVRLQQTVHVSLDLRVVP